MQKQLIIGGVIAGGLALTAIGAVAGYRSMDQANYGEVIAVKPAMKTISVPREECRDELVTRTQPTKDPNQIAGTVAGAVVGGVLGNQVGSGTGKDIATVAGAAAGGYAGNKIQEGMQERNTYQESQRVCDTVNDKRQEQVGYDVTYRYDGQEKTVRMDYDPGNRLPVENGEVVVRR